MAESTREEEILRWNATLVQIYPEIKRYTGTNLPRHQTLHWYKSIRKNPTPRAALRKAMCYEPGVRCAVLRQAMSYADLERCSGIKLLFPYGCGIGSTEDGYVLRGTELGYWCYVAWDASHGIVLRAWYAMCGTSYGMDSEVKHFAQRINGTKLKRFARTPSVLCARSERVVLTVSTVLLPGAKELVANPALQNDEEPPETVLALCQ
eukprot:3940309-Rhodomonas_salina.1